MSADSTTNLGVYRAPEIVAHYAGLNYLTAAERLLFETHLKPGLALLDLGVGGGARRPIFRASHRPTSGLTTPRK